MINSRIAGILFQTVFLFWPDYNGVICLDTECKEYKESWGENKIISIKGCKWNSYPKGKRVTWSQYLYWVLELIGTDIVLYLQEDYFFQ